jgi:LmbE family N-acetylglucosaminyl deacetylase
MQRQAHLNPLLKGEGLRKGKRGSAWPAALRPFSSGVFRGGVLASFLIVLFLSCPALTAEPTNSAPAILEEMKCFRELGSVLYIAAHPDDENTLLIGYLARGRNYRTAYLSLTRGDGGQNVLGPQFDEQLGVARTQELLAARRLDGGRQFFSRAMDFGFSKDYQETLRIWDQQGVLSDVVRVIREFRPDVVINRFSTKPGGTHGHHTASAVLGLEAFHLAGDTNAFPGQHLPPWQPQRIFVNGRNEGGIHLDISGNDSVTGLSFNDLAMRSRAMHKTQGFDNFRGFGGGNGPRAEYFQLLAGPPATNDIFDGIDTTWNRVPGGAGIDRQADALIANFNPYDIASSVPALLELRRRVAALPDKDSVLIEKSAQLDHILESCLGLEVETTLPQSEMVPGETLHLQHSAVTHSDLPIRWVAVRYPTLNREVPCAIVLGKNGTNYVDSDQPLPASTPLTQPYWLREDHTAGMFVVDDPSLIGRPENSPAFPIEEVFQVGGQTLVIADEPVQITTNSAGAETRRKLEVIPPVSLKFASKVALFAPGKSRSVAVEITAFRPGLSGTLQLEMPAGWTASPAQRNFSLAAVGNRESLAFSVTAPNHPDATRIAATAEVGGVRYRNEREEIAYPHIPRQLLQPPARLKALSLELANRSHAVGYLPGAGDTVADCLKEMGCDVTLLADADLTTNNLHRFDAVVIGVRAFNVSTNLAPRLPALFDYVHAGGTLIVQYNRPDNLKAAPLAPYDLHLSNLRVTDETAPVTLLEPESPVLNSPNKIVSADFDGWVQERGIYFPDQWDEHFTPILACSDPGEPPLKGGLLVAIYGQGHYVYTGLVFFRELPAGVPGAYRLLANLISLGK